MVSFSAADKNFASNLPRLRTQLQPRQPVYLILRKSQNPDDLLTAVTYVPSDAPVRQKTLYASTRATLTRELGSEKFEQNVFATEPEEVVDPQAWEERVGGSSTAAGGAAAATGAASGSVNDHLLSREERELQDVKRAEEEERHGTKGRDLMGTSGGGGSGTSTPRGESSSGLRMNLSPSARTGLASMGPRGENRSGPERGRMVQLGIDPASETVVLLSSAPCLEPNQVCHSIPPDKPSYTFYHYPSTGAVVFVYACPAVSKVREKMLYASTRAHVLELARAEGVEVRRRLEIGEPDEIAQDRLKEELEVAEENHDHPTTTTAGTSARQGFARPKRPGKR